MSREEFTRYFVGSSREAEKAKIEWHLEFCPVCRKEIVPRELVDIAKDARNQLAGGIRRAARN